MGVKYSKYVVIDVGANLMTVLRVAASIYRRSVGFVTCRSLFSLFVIVIKVLM